MKTTRNLLMTGLVAAFCCSMANAQIIYSNAFNGGHANINNTGPTVANDFAGGSSSGVWLDALGTNDVGFLNQNGQISSSLPNSWTLPFTPQAGYVYHLTATLSFSGNPGTWVGIGFAALNNTDNIVGYGRYADHGTDGGLTTGGPDGANWMILTESSGNIQYFTGPHTVGQVVSGNGLFTAGLIGNLALDITLDTSGSLWSMSATVDGSPLEMNKQGANVYTYTYTANPTIGAVGFTQNGVGSPQNYQWSDFMLTAVPEPSTSALVGVGLAMVVLVALYRRRQREAVR